MDVPAPEPGAADIVDRVRAMLAAHPYGFLVTTALGGGVSSRLVQHAAVDDDLSVWFGTSPTSRKAVELARHPTGAYSVEDRTTFGAVTLHGRATIQDDATARRRAWAAGFEAFFPGGLDGPDFTAVHLTVERLEVIDFAHAIHPDPYGLTSRVCTRTARGWEVADQPAKGQAPPSR